jgi:hypothetical protein
MNVWFFKLPSEARKNQSMYYFRMVEPDFTPMPVYESMKDYTADLKPTLYPGHHQETHWALAYEGAWSNERGSEEAMLEGYRRAAEPGATVRFAFEGAALTLVPGPGAGEIEVSINGDEARRIVLNGQPVQVMTSQRQQRHQVTLTAVSGAVGVDALIIDRPWRPLARLGF